MFTIKAILEAVRQMLSPVLLNSICWTKSFRILFLHGFSSTSTKRALEGDINQDGGAQIRDGMSSIKTLGVCSETDWPYDVSQFSVTPTDSVFQKASANKAIQYFALDANLNQIKACLVAGFPFVFGMSVFDSFESETVAQTGVVPMPGENENCIGGHAVMCVGYDDTKDSFLVRNSWGLDGA